LSRRNSLGKYDIFPPKLGVVSERTVEIKARPAFPVAFACQTLQYHHVRRRCGGFGTQLIHVRVLLEKSFVYIILRCSHDDLLEKLLRFMDFS
jgi:hypothetical protein